MNPASSASETRVAAPALQRPAPAATSGKAGSPDTAAPAKQTATESERISEHELRARLQKTLDELNEQLRQSGREIGFSIDRDTEQLVVTVTNRETGELVRQIPLKAFARVAEHADQLKGLLLDEMR